MQDNAADHLEMGEDEVDAIVDPFVALITGPLGGVNKKYGRQSLEILGVLPAALAMVTWRARVRDFERAHCPPRQKRGQHRAQVPQRADGEENFTPARLTGHSLRDRTAQVSSALSPLKARLTEAAGAAIDATAKTVPPDRNAKMMFRA